MPRYSGGSEAVDAGNLRERLFKFYDVLLSPKYAVLFLVFIASAIRLIPMRFKYLLGYDPYFHLAYIKYALSHGWVNFFPYAFGPWGFQVRHFHPLGLWMMPVYVYRVLSIFGVSIYNAFRVTPVIYGVLTVIFVYLAVLKLYGRREAFLSAFFLAVLFGHVFRSMAGYYRGDNYMLFWYSVALLGMALAISGMGDGPKWGRLFFYLIPAIASGLSAVFWRAYYPIFVFLLSSAVFIAIGAFLLERREFFGDAMVIVLATVFGAFFANLLGSRFGYGMLGASEALGQKFASEFGVHFGIIRDAFLLIYLKYAVPVSLLVIGGLFVLSRFLKPGRARVIVVGVGGGVVFLLFLAYYGRVSSLISGLFPTWIILETERTSWRDVWVAYGVVSFLVPFFILRFLPRQVRLVDFMLLGLIVVEVPMIFTWVRFLFIGSLAVALMAGIGLVTLYEVLSPRVSGRKLVSVAFIIILIVVPMVAAFQGIHRVDGVQPLVNGAWERALETLKGDSNINDVVLTWWDEGNWITYYSERAPVAQLYPSKFVAEYYLGMKSEKALMERGVDFVVVSYDLLMKFGAVLQTAGVSSGEYAMIPMPLISTGGNVLLFSVGPYSIMVTPRGGSWSVKVNVGGSLLIPRAVFIERGKSVEKVQLVEKPNADVYVYVNLNYGYAVLMNERMFNTPLARLMFTNEYPNFTEVYSDGGYIKIFKFEHPNVEVTRDNGRIVLKFSNSSGNVLGIFGYLDNGTRVFKKWYNVKGKTEFTLPNDLNGSVVVRYVYIRNKTVLDRGVFRIKDVVSG